MRWWENTFVQKLMGTAGAVGIYLLGVKYPQLEKAFDVLAGGIAGGMWIRSPGHVKLEAAKAGDQ